MIYLDNSATTPIDPEVFEAMKPYLQEEFGNPSSKYYLKAENAKRAVEDARQKIADLINANNEEIIFTSGASESNNFIIKGVADYKKNIEGIGNHIITSKVEHKSVLETCRFLNGEVYMNVERNKFFNTDSKKVDRGYEVTFLDVNEYGQVETKSLDTAIKESTVLTSLIWGNNEIGTLNDIKALSSLCKSREVLFHSDATQVLGKIHIDVKTTEIDFLSFSGHKLYGPKGIGACYIKSGDFVMPDITSLIHGGSQEFGYRAGTHSVHNIVGFGKAAEIAKRDMEKYVTHISQLEEHVKRGLAENILGVEFLGDPDNHIPGVINFTIPNINNELFIKKVSGIAAISTGSACSLGEPSYVIEAIGKRNYTTNVIRVSLNKYNSLDDIKNFISVFK